MKRALFLKIDLKTILRLSITDCFGLYLVLAAVQSVRREPFISTQLTDLLDFFTIECYSVLLGQNDHWRVNSCNYRYQLTQKLLCLHSILSNVPVWFRTTYLGRGHFVRLFITEQFTCTTRPLCLHALCQYAKGNQRQKTTFICQADFTVMWSLALQSASICSYSLSSFERNLVSRSRHDW